MIDMMKQQTLIHDEKIDISETSICNKDHELLEILLKDRTTTKNIIWGTNYYKKHGKKYAKNSQIMVNIITGSNEGIIKPRVEKNKIQQQLRAREKAEVFTPSWICNKQNNLVDNAWFGYENIFNKEIDNGWETIEKKIEFKNELKTWKDYVTLNRLEIACGEAPYITSRYDSVSGDYILVKDRIGLLDRKLRVIGENISIKEEWIEWAMKALKSIYAYDFQGDNVLLARENVLYTIKEFYEDKFKDELDKGTLRQMATIISWNIWQMDGIKFVVPGSCKIEKKVEYTLFEGKKITEEKCIGCQNNDNHHHNGVYCKIMDWEKKKTIKFIDLLGG